MPITCRYVLTVAEFQHASGAYSLAKPLTPKTQLILFGWVVMAFNLIIVVGHLHDLATKPYFLLGFLGCMNVLLLLSGVLVLFFDVIRAGRPRRRRGKLNTLLRSGLLNVTLEITIADSGITVDQPDRKTDWRWISISSVCEDKDGFILTQPKSRNFIWLPKSGFNNDPDVDSARVILQRHVPEFRRLA